MVRTVLGLAGAGALAAFLIAAGGCSSESEGQKQEAEDGTDAGRGRDAGRRPTVPHEPPEAGEPPEPTCMAERPIDATKFGYKPAGVAEGACSPDEARAISEFFSTQTREDADVSVAEWQQAVGDACARCVFSDGEGDTWTPIITKGDRLETVNRGGCIQAASGSEECGKAYQQVTECRLAACLPPSEGGFGTCMTQGEFEECLADGEAILTGPCQEAHIELKRSCGKDLGSYEEACGGQIYTFEGPIRVMCVGEETAPGGEEGEGGGDGEE